LQGGGEGTPVGHCEHPGGKHLHGTYAAYKNCGCRCDSCQTAYETYTAGYRARRAAGRREVRFDPVAVERALAGERIPLSRPERLEAVRRLHAARLSDRQIGQRLGVCTRTVLRCRRSLGLPAVEQYGDLPPVRRRRTAA
jgi:hypothetical protein